MSNKRAAAWAKSTRDSFASRRNNICQWATVDATMNTTLFLSSHKHKRYCVECWTSPSSCPESGKQSLHDGSKRNLRLRKVSRNSTLVSSLVYLLRRHPDWMVLTWMSSPKTKHEGIRTGWLVDKRNYVLPGACPQDVHTHAACRAELEKAT